MNEFDVLTYGETMVRLTPPNLLRIEQATTLDVEVGGSESNTAVGLARLGLKTAWLSGLPDNPLGRMVAGVLRRYGVDTSHVVWKENGRLGLYFLEKGKPPRGSSVIYDREHSVFSQLNPSDIPSAIFEQSAPKHLHFSGISLALTEQSRQTMTHLLSLAQNADWTISFDPNYRQKLWTIEESNEACAPFLKAATINFLAIRDAIAFYDLPAQSTPEAVIEHLASLFPQSVLVLTLGADGAIGKAPHFGAVYQPAFPAEEVDRLGGGDSFAAGFLYGYLQQAGSKLVKMKAGLLWGVATAAFKYSTVGDMPIVEHAQVEALVNAKDGLNTSISR